MFNGIYHIALRALHLRHTITYSIQREARTEPLVLVLLAITGGLVWNSAGGWDNLIRDYTFLIIGLLLGHLFWSTPARS